MRSNPATAVDALVSEDWFVKQDQRDLPALVATIQSNLTNSATRPHVRQILERLVDEAITAAADNCCLFAPSGCDHVATAIAEDLLWEYGRRVGANHSGISPEAPIDAYDDDDFEPVSVPGPDGPVTVRYTGQTDTGAVPSIVPWTVFSHAFRLVLGQTAKVTKHSPANTAKSFDKTREGSTKFESWWVDTLLMPHQDEIVEAGTKALRSHIHNRDFDLELVSVLPDLTGKTEQGKSITFADLWVTIKVTSKRMKHEEILRAPVNVKYLSLADRTSANSAGAKMLSWAMLGGVYATSKNAHLMAEVEKALRERIPMPASDYFFLVFEKGDGDKPVGRSKVSSLLSMDPSQDVLYFNPSQSFPHVQVRFVECDTSRYHSETVYEARHRLWEWMGAHARRQLIEGYLVFGAGQVAPGLVLPEGVPLKDLPPGFVLHPEDQARYDARRAAEAQTATP